MDFGDRGSWGADERAKARGEGAFATPGVYLTRAANAGPQAVGFDAAGKVQTRITKPLLATMWRRAA